MFSVVIPMFNASQHIVKTLESCIEQTYLPQEIIVVDDCSSDDSYALVQKWIEQYSGEIEVVLEGLERNSGPSKARNVGWDLANAEYVAFLDADDRFISKKLETIAEVLHEQKEIVLLGHAYALVDQKKNDTSNLEKISTKDLLLKNLTTTPSVIVKRNIEERFDESMRYTEDHDLWLRITQKYDETYFLDTVLTIIDRPVRAEGGQSSNLWAMRKGEIQMYRKYCKANKMMILFPLFATFSLSKHFIKMIK